MTTITVELRELFRQLVSEVERRTCEHEETHRGGAIWEICNMCGAKWADDEGGKPEFQWPDCVERARVLLSEQPHADTDHFPDATKIVEQPQSGAGQCATCNGVGIVGHSELCPECNGETQPAARHDQGDEVRRLREALNGLLLHVREPESESEFQWPDHFKKQKAAFIAARAALAAQGGVE